MSLGFIGSGKMANALVRGVVQAGVVPASEIRVSDHLAEVAQTLARESGVLAVPSNADVVAHSDTVVLCVKPGDALPVLQSLAAPLAGKLLISIVAGLPLSALQGAAGPECRVIRVMPNTAALVHKGAAAFALGAGATAEDSATCEKLFRAVGVAHRVPEYLLDAVTGLSGSGPAYVYLAIEALADGGVLMGLPRALALQLAAQTLAGAAEMVLQTGEHPGVLRDAVTSPGGTTIAGLEALEQHGARGAFIAAVRAATERAQQLGQPK